MKVHARNTVLTCATLAGVLMLSACGKNDQESNTTPTAPATSAPAQPAVPAPAGTAAPMSPASTPAPTSTSPAPAATTGKSTSLKPAANITVAAVTVGNQLDGTRAISKEQRHFAPEDKAIYASVATTGRSDNATLNAKWSYEDGNGQLFSSTTESIATDGPAVTTFKVQNPNAWPAGKYKVVISLNGKAVASENFEVRS
jgi:hypothetical protein